MDTYINVEIKSIYGKQRIYPACEKAETFCKLIGQNTLTDLDVQRIKELGFEVRVKPSHPATL